jgi:DNA-binding SARP family transcriptional activator
MVETSGRVGPSVSLLGGFTARQDRARLVLPLSAQRLVAFLALNRRVMMRNYVAGVLWPDAPQARAEASLRSTLWRMGRAGASLIETSTTHLAIARTLAVDVHDIVELVYRLMDPTVPCAHDDFDPGRLAGELLPDWTEEDWLYLERERVRQLCLHGLEAQSMRLMTEGRYGEAVEAGLAAVRAEPLRESAHRRLIEIYMSEGNAAEALRQYDWYRRVLYSELGLEPSPDITRLVHRFRAPVQGPPAGRQLAAGWGSVVRSR